MGCKGICKGVFLVMALFLSSTLGTMVMVTPTLPIIFLSPRLSRRIMDYLMGLWFYHCVAMYEMFMGVKIVVTGNPPPKISSSLVLCNHRTRLDWLFFMSYICRFSALNQYRITLKASLKKFPGAGWAMQCAGFLFLKRNWAEDQQHISSGINYFSKVRSKPQILLFPEGTDMCKNSLARSHKFAETKGYDKYYYVLHPKSTGFVHFVKEMKKGQILDYILDVSMGYPKKLVQSEIQFLKGEFPEEIHIHVDAYPVEIIPETDEELEMWLRELWAKKEKRLKRFYEFKKFEEGTDEEVLAQGRKISEENLRKYLIYVFAFWLAFLFFVFLSLAISPMFRIFCFVGCLSFVIINIRQGGVDNVIYSAVQHHE